MTTQLSIWISKFTKKVVIIIIINSNNNNNHNEYIYPCTSTQAGHVSQKFT